MSRFIPAKEGVDAHLIWLVVSIFSCCFCLFNHAWDGLRCQLFFGWETSQQGDYKVFVALCLFPLWICFPCVNSKWGIGVLAATKMPTDHVGQLKIQNPEFRGIRTYVLSSIIKSCLHLGCNQFSGSTEHHGS